MKSSDLEPESPWEEIQGNVLAGFNKDHQTLLGFSFGGSRENARAFLRAILPRITALREVYSFKVARRARLRALGREPLDMFATWIAAAFSYEGLRTFSPSTELFVDTEFRSGLAASSTRIGDVEGGYLSWQIGAPDRVPDLLLVVAADRDGDVRAAVESIASVATSTGISEIYREEGHDLSYYSSPARRYESGREHFGFKDGVSQPGIRGVLPNGEFLTPRFPQAGTQDGPEFASPGKPLLCVGQFVLGYAQQLDAFPRQAGRAQPLGSEPGAIGPAWALNGSFLVFRRLRQDVAAFQRFVDEESVRLSDPSMPSSRLAALLVGRWPTGAPVLRAPIADDPAQASEERINAFAFGAENPKLGLPDDGDGLICPVAAHVRKVNPRDENTDQGSASATLNRRILRRGIPYGPPLEGGSNVSAKVDRGLLFISYQASIRLQFEFLCAQWMNDPMLPRNPSGIAEGLGFDLLVGQNGIDRTRFAYLRSEGADRRVTTSAFSPRDWVSATGGGYFFAPSMSAMRLLCNGNIGLG